MIEEFKSLSIDLRLAFQEGTLEPWDDQYFDEWVIEKPYDLVPNYISPFEVGKRIN